MKALRILMITTVFAAAPSWAQQAKTTEQQARSYILSAFMTGAAPLVLSDDVKVSPVLLERLHLPPDSDSRTVYLSIVQHTAGRSLAVRLANPGEVEKADAQAQPGKPVFSLDVANSTFVMQYDLVRDTVTYVGDSSRPVAVTSPVAGTTPPQPISENEPPVRMQVVEPREPRMVVQPVAQAPRERLKPTGPCTVKPVMSDQDLVNCGATPR